MISENGGDAGWWARQVIHVTCANCNAVYDTLDAAILCQHRRRVVGVCDWQDSTPARRHCTRDATVRREGRAMCAHHADLADERKAARP